MKSAYLIIAHNEFAILQKLVSSLDDERNDIYIHFDKKVKVLPDIKAQKSPIYVLDNRIDVRWGTIRQIETEFALFKAAAQNRPYDFYHLISGTHLPLKSQDFIHSCFDCHQGQVIARVWPEDQGDADFKLRRYHFWINRFQGPGKVAKWFCQRLWTLNMKIQKVFGIRHLKQDKFVKTDNWLSLPEDAVNYLLNNRKDILKKYRYSFCGDEYFVASELSEKYQICDLRNLLYVEFNGANPKTLTMDDYERLKATDYLFARKFSSR